jgi:hypothetical protein
MSDAAIDTEIYHNGRTYAEHCAWLDSLVGDDYRIVHMPIGHLFSLALVSGFKRVLLTQQTTVRQRIKFLDGIAQCIYGCVTLEAVTAIEPCCETGEKMLLEIFSLPSSEQTQAFSKGDVFQLLAKLNPSLLTALRLCTLHDQVPEEPRNRALELCR